MATSMSIASDLSDTVRDLADMRGDGVSVVVIDIL